MSDNKVTVEIGAEDKFSDVVNKFNDAIKGAGDKSQSAMEKAKGASQAFALGLAGLGAAAIAFGVSAFNAYGEAELAQKQLEHAVIDVSHATKEQLAQTEALSDALEKKGVLDGDNIKVGLAQLSTFGLSNKAVQALGGSLADLAVNQFGVNASGEQLSQSANMIAKALNGQFGVLEKSGIRFTDLQKHIIATGTEMEKTKAINEGFAQNLKLTNEVAMQTGEGIKAHIGVQLQNLQEAVGKVISEAILPMGVAFSKWIETLGPADVVIAGVIKRLEEIKPYFPIIAGAIIGGLIPAIYAMGVAMVTSIGATVIALGPFVLIGASIASVLYLLKMAWDTNFLGMRDTLVEVFNSISEFWAKWSPVFLVAFKLIWDGLKAFFKLWKDALTGDWSALWTDIQVIAKTLGALLGKVFEGVFTNIKNTITGTLDSIKAFFQDWWNTITGWVNDIITKLGIVQKFASDAFSALKSAATGKASSGGGKAFGGMVEGPAGLDNIMTPLSAGEVVLNAAQQQNVASSIGSGKGATEININLSGNSFYGDDPRFIQKIGDQIVSMLLPHIPIQSF